jgi:hypothetical protein
MHLVEWVSLAGEAVGHHGSIDNGPRVRLQFGYLDHDRSVPDTFPGLLVNSVNPVWLPSRLERFDDLLQQIRLR